VPLRPLYLWPLLLFSASIVSQRVYSQSSTHERNAAVDYLRADVSLRQSYPVREKEWEELEKSLTSPLDERDEKLVVAAAEALVEFDHAANSPHCDWQVSIEDGPLANTSHRGAMRELTAVAGIRARIRLRAGDVEGATTDVVDALTAARHLTGDGSLASVLFGFRVENQISDVLVNGLPLFSRSQLLDVQRRLTRLPTGSDMQNALQSEKLDHKDLALILSSAKTRQELIQALATGIPTLNGDESKASEIVQQCGGTIQGMEGCIEQQRGFYSRWMPLFRIPPEDFERRYTTDFAKSSARNPVIAMFTPNLSRLRWVQAYQDTRRALLGAAVAVQISGANALADQRDPYDQSSFTYLHLQHGFRIESRLKENGVPLSLTVQSSPTSASTP
jgi:hypothetical protein